MSVELALLGFIMGSSHVPSLASMEHLVVVLWTGGDFSVLFLLSHLCWAAL
jgi:hypothetical protein